MSLPFPTLPLLPLPPLPVEIVEDDVGDEEDDGDKDDDDDEEDEEDEDDDVNEFHSAVAMLHCDLGDICFTIPPNMRVAMRLDAFLLVEVVPQQCPIREACDESKWGGVGWGRRQLLLCMEIDDENSKVGETNGTREPTYMHPNQ
jgi:hypothetical protein